jgi:hypothetical protein
MPSRPSVDRIRVIHPHEWLWEPLETDPTFVLRAMFGAKAVYLHGRMALCFCASEEPWRGLLVCTDRTQHAALTAEFPALVPHAILPKWLYLAETGSTFERDAAKLVALAGRRDPRIGIEPKPRKKPRARARALRQSRIK